MATYCQGDNLFSADSSGRQCTAIATAAALYTTTTPIAEWTRLDLDYIFLSGDSLYKEVIKGRPSNEHGYLLISDIPEQVVVFNETYRIKRAAALCGLMSAQQMSEEATGIEDAVQRVFLEQSAAILIIKDSSVMVCRDKDGIVFVFDSHARDQNGLPSADGKAVLMKLKDQDDLLQYLHEVGSALTDGDIIATYEIVGIEVVAERRPEVCFHAFFLKIHLIEKHIFLMSVFFSPQINY